MCLHGTVLFRAFMTRLVCNQIARTCLFFTFFVLAFLAKFTFNKWLSQWNCCSYKMISFKQLPFMVISIALQFIICFGIIIIINIIDNISMAGVVVVVGAQFLLKLSLSSGALLRIINKLLHKNRLQTWYMWNRARSLINYSGNRC